MRVWIETTDTGGHVYRQRIGHLEAETLFDRMTGGPFVTVRLLEQIGSDRLGLPSWRVVRRWDRD